MRWGAQAEQMTVTDGSQSCQLRPRIAWKRSSFSSSWSDG
jgi:hypothetical protein